MPVCALRVVLNVSQAKLSMGFASGHHNRRWCGHFFLCGHCSFRRVDPRNGQSTASTYSWFDLGVGLCTRIAEQAMLSSVPSALRSFPPALCICCVLWPRCAAIAIAPRGFLLAVLVNKKGLSCLVIFLCCFMGLCSVTDSVYRLVILRPGCCLYPPDTYTNFQFSSWIFHL